MPDRADKAADARAEKALHVTIAEKFPKLYDREVTARRAYQQRQQAKQAAQHQPVAVVHPQPDQSRGRGMR